MLENREMTPVEAGETRMEFVYTTMDEAPAVHRDICKYLAVGWSTRQIAAYLKVKGALVNQVANHSPAAEHVLHLESFRDEMVLRQSVDMQTLFDAALAGLLKDVNDPETKPADRLKMASFVADRLPDSRFVVQKRTEHRRTSTVVTAADMLKLSQEAGELGRPAPRDVTPGGEGLTTPNHAPSAAPPGLNPHLELITINPCEESDPDDQ